jgi:hypothetical protein
MNTPLERPAPPQATEPMNDGFLDRLVCPDFRLGRHTVSAFRACGVVGLTAAVMLAMTLVVYTGHSPWVMAGVVLAAMATFLSLAMATKIVTGQERLIYYHHEIAVLVVAALLLWLTGQPVLPYLDATTLGVGAFLTCGRVGCLMVGCCHGRPHRWGVCYRAEHAAAGFTPYYVGVRLFPVQAVESLWVAAVVVVGAWMVWTGPPAGAALAWYVVAYDVGRFLFEFTRGDPDRPYLAGFSEGQWLSVVLTWAVVGAQWTDVLPWHPWHTGAAAGLSLAMLGVALARRWRTTRYHLLRHPRHVRELADAVLRVSDPPAVATTGLGICVSAGLIQRPAGLIYHYAFSAAGGTMTLATAQTLAGIILQLRHPSCVCELVTGAREVYHLLIPPPGKPSGARP